MLAIMGASLGRSGTPYMPLVSRLPLAHRTIQLLSANPLALAYDKLAAILQKVRAHLPEMEITGCAASTNASCARRLASRQAGKWSP